MKNQTAITLLLLGIFLTGCAAQTETSEAQTQFTYTPTQIGAGSLLVTVPVTTSIPIPETKITIDGDSSDWDEYEVLLTDPQGDNEGGDFDITAVRAFSNNKFLYVLVETHQPTADYSQVDLNISAGGRDFIVSFQPQNASLGFMGDITGGEFKEIGQVEGSQSAAAEAVEFKLPLSVFEDTSELILSVSAMAGECCEPPEWYAVDSTDNIAVVALNEVEPVVDLVLPPPSPPQAKMIPQTQLDLSRYRCDEPADIVTNTDRTLAYTVCGNVDTLFVIDTNTDQVIDVLPLHGEAEHPFGTTPRLIEITPDDATLLVGNEIDRSLSLVDANTLSVINTLRLDMKPAKIAVSPDGKVAYVVGHDSGQLTVIDIENHQILTQTPLPDAKAPYSVAFAPDGSAAYAAAIEGGMYQIDPVSHQIIAHVVLPQAGGRGDMVVTQDGSTVYLAATDSNWIAEIDSATMTLTRQIDVPMPQALLLNPDETLMYIGVFNPYTSVSPLQVLDLGSGEVVDEINLTTPAPHVSWAADIETIIFVGDDSRLYVPCIDADGIFIIDAATQRQIGFIPLTAFATLQPEHLIISADGTALYTLNLAPQAPSISLVNTVSGKAENFYYLETDDPCFASTGNRQSPDKREQASIALMPDSTTLFVSTDTCLLTFDTTSKTFIKATPIDIPAGHAIQDFVVSPDGGQIYVIDTDGVLFTLDGQTMEVTASVQAVNHGYNIKVSPDNSRVYVTGWEEYAVIDPITNTVLVRDAIYVGGSKQLSAYQDRAIGIPPGHEFYTIGDFFYMQVFNSETNVLLRSIDLELWAPSRTLVTDVIFSLDGEKGYLALWDMKGIVVFDTNTWEMIAQIDTGFDPVYCVCPNDFAISPDGSQLYVTCEQSDNIIVIDTTINQIIDVIDLVP